jgi:WD40 repeat protein
MPISRLDATSSICSGKAISERVAARRTRVRLLTLEQVLAAGLIAALIGLFSAVSGGPKVERPAQAAGGNPLVVEAVAFSPDGRVLASSGGTNSIRLWDIEPGRQPQSTRPEVLHSQSIRFALAFSPDGAYLASTGSGSISLWVRRTGGYDRVADRIGVSGYCLAFKADSSAVAVGCEDGAIRVYAVAGLDEQATLRRHMGAVRNLAFSPDARTLVSSGQDRLVLVWNTARGEVVRNLSEPGFNAVQFAALSPDGKTVAVAEPGWSPQDVTLLDTDTGLVKRRLKGSQEGVGAIAFSPDGRTLAVAGADRRITLWNVATGEVEIALSDQVGLVKSLAFSPDGADLAFAGPDAAIRVWNRASGRTHVLGSS